jgi:hypothetical protein
MLRIRPRLRKIRIRILDQWILIAMPKLLLQANISLRLVMFRFIRAFLHVLIFPNFRHDFLDINDGSLDDERRASVAHFTTGVFPGK